jgi:hypothetical protein
MRLLERVEDGLSHAQTPPSGSQFPLSHRNLRKLIDSFPRVVLMLLFPNQTQGLQSTETVVHCPGRKESAAYQVLPGHPASVPK